MKQFESNPLQQELARSQQAGPHPDSDLLTAFAEGTLLERERQNIFAHLARCADCRELLSAATGAASDPVAGLRPFLVHRSARPALRARLTWASIAAGILVVCSAGLVYRQKLELRQRPTIASENAPGLPLTTIQKAQSTSDEVPEKRVRKTASSAGPRPLKAIRSEAAHQSAVAAKAVSDGPVTQPSALSQASSAFANTETAHALSNRSVEASLARPHWRINGAGHAERSFGDEAWQPVLANENTRMRVVSVFDSEVWVGGENTLLYHSSDNGNAWNIVPLPTKNGNNHIIIHVRFQTPLTGTVEAADGTSWTTADGGIKWN
jgi:hypothetical protein